MRSAPDCSALETETNGGTTPDRSISRRRTCLCARVTGAPRLQNRNVDQALTKDHRARFVSFSGIDGAGKSTQIQFLSATLQQVGLRVRTIAFWDEVATLTRLREDAGHRIFRGDRGVGSPSAPIQRRDKNVRSRFMTAVRLWLYLFDAISTRRAVRQALRSGADLVIFDRYIYDELANLTLSKALDRVYVRMVAKLIPRPDVSYLLDADPHLARARKPEYPLDFIYLNRESYLQLSALIGGITVIDPMPISDVQREILEHARRALRVEGARAETPSRPA